VRGRAARHHRHRLPPFLCLGCCGRWGWLGFLFLLGRGCVLHGLFCERGFTVDVLEFRVVDDGVEVAHEVRVLGAGGSVSGDRDCELDVCCYGEIGESDAFSDKVGTSG
jgi:hypothetical protein